MTDKIEKMNQGFTTAFIDYSMPSSLAYKPQLISNDPKAGKKVLTTIEEELLACEEFYISVAFIKMAGLEPLLQTLKTLEGKGVSGKILTTDYYSYSEPKALERLNSLKNVELRMYCVPDTEGFHTKGYIFRKKEIYNIIVGSSNITSRALTMNKEWNLRFVSTEQGELVKDLLEEFETFWSSERTVSYEACAGPYATRYRIAQAQKKAARAEDVTFLDSHGLKPNSMQVDFVQNLRKIRNTGETRALLISSTGTGKTFAAAFAVKDLEPKRILFLVHREQILRQAKWSFQRVFGSKKKMEILSGNAKDLEKIKSADFVFSMMNMMAKDDVRSQFEADAFSMIIIDEVHRAASNSYQKIMGYFQPDFWLGMTASPDRPDGYDIYQLFHHNIAYEIRLQQALEHDLLCPFHYFGITDLELNGEVFDDNTGKLKRFNLLASDQRVDYVIEKIEYFGYSGERVKGLIFCSTIDEAKLLSEKFNVRGYRTCALSGEDSEEKREAAIERLTSDERRDYLDYIFTVDIFNEGVDIPEVNQVVMLRPTESPIVFIQQLGRGLRKFEGKEYVVVLDFIGNYTNNYLIPIALSGDRSRNKDTLRRYIAEGTRIIPGSSSIHFDEITKERIYRSIDTAKVNKVQDIVYEYRCLKNKLGRIPDYKDFENFNTIDMTCIFDNPNLGSYHNFLKKYEKEYPYKDALTDKQEEMLLFVSQKIADGKRADELLLLRRVLTYYSNLEQQYSEDLERQCGIQYTKRRRKNVVKVLTNDFVPAETQKKKFSRSIFVKEDGDNLEISDQLKQEKRNPVFWQLMLELVEYGLLRHEKYYSDRYKETDFVLWQKYKKSDVCRLLEWSKNQNPQNVGGYFYDRETKTLPVFITYKKEDVTESQNYEDQFLSPSELISISKSGRSFSSPEMNYFYDPETKIYLFVQKSSNDVGASEYYFLGQIYNTGERDMMKRPDVGDTVLRFHYNLDVPVPENLYQYFTHDYIPTDQSAN